MYFPVAEATLALWYLIGIGCAIGVCGGFMGMGGGWILVPALMALGVRENIAIGTSLAQMLGHAIVSTFRHWQFGNVSIKIALVMIPGTAIGIEIGARILEALKALGEAQTEHAIGGLYVVLLLSLALFMYRDVSKASRKAAEANAAQPGDSATPPDEEETSRLALWVQSLKLYPCISCSISQIQSISVWVIFFSAIVTGVLTGLLGVGGGLLRLPMLIYLIGCPTTVAVGTDLFAIIFSGSYGTFTHALKGNVDLLMAFYIFLGAAVGAQVGAFATRYVKGTQIRGVFAFLALIAGVSVIANSFLKMQTLAVVLIIGVTALTAGLIVVLLVIGVRQKTAETSGT